MPTWTPALLGRFLEERSGFDCSTPNCWRLMREAGLCHQEPR
ncbi:winged helix-turn-helix domain-containing protein [Halogranum rubrum]